MNLVLKLSTCILGEVHLLLFKSANRFVRNKNCLIFTYSVELFCIDLTEYIKGRIGRSTYYI